MFMKFRGHPGFGLRSALIAAFLLLVSGAAFAIDLTDASGQVTVRIYFGPWVYGQHNNTSISVDSDFVLVGGGAEIYGPGHPGALLTGSYPDSNLITWHASSKDHESRYLHSLRAWAIGLRLNGVSSTELRNHMILVTQASTESPRPNAVAALPPGYLLVGGGARANWDGAGVLLTDSYPSAFQWVASAKDHRLSDPGTVDAFVIGITSGSIPGFGSLSATYNSSTTYINTADGTASVQTPVGWVLTSVGGQAQYSSGGRMLWQLFPYGYAPNRGAARATSKDHNIVSSGYTSAYAISIQKQ